MKKIISIILSVLMLAALTAGCAKPSKPDAQGSGTSASDAVTSAADTTATSIAPTTTQPTDSESTAFDAAQCAAALDAIMAHQPGTAGSSLKCLIATVAVLDWTETLSGTEGADITATAQSWLAKLTPEQAEQFAMNLAEVDFCARDICENGIDADLADSAGVQPSFESYSVEKYELFSDALTALVDISQYM